MPTLHRIRYLIPCVLILAALVVVLAGARPCIAVEPIEGVEILSDVPYKADAETEYERERCKLDLYIPEGREDFATMIWLHGGSIQSGDKAGDIAMTVVKRFTSEGVAGASVNYRLSPKATFPAYIDDVAAAFAYVHREIAKHGGSPDAVFISGHSAGGYLTAMAGMDPQYVERYGLSTDDIAGLLPVAGQMITHSTVREERGVLRSKPRMDEAAPSYHVRRDAPPCLNIAGDRDMPARAEENAYFIAAMKAAGHEDATYLQVADRDHGAIASRIGEADDPAAKAMLAFIHRIAE